MQGHGKILGISGPMVKGEGLTGVKMYETVQVGEDRLIGEVVRIFGEIVFVQVYEATTGVRPGEPIYRTGEPLSVSLGPGLLTSIYDGIQRPLNVISRLTGFYIKRGLQIPPLNLEKKWKFEPRVKAGERVGPGDLLGLVQETALVEHRVLVPPNYPSGVVRDLPEGDFTVEQDIGTLEADGKKLPLRLAHQWPVRKGRPYVERLDPELPLITGQRVLDVLFPMAKGGTGAIPGAFGTGKTVALHQVASWADAKVVIYIGCGERGNEITEMLVEFPHLKDPATGRPLMERTVLIANTSNMPVAAREASIYTGVTVGEYYRDQGYDVVLVADSTSRWAEALREIGGRLEEMPAEEGYPPYLASRLAEFYERAGRVRALGRHGSIGSVTLVGAVSPPGGDFTDPVTTHTLRFIKTFWALDDKLAYSRHYPAINWMQSYSGYLNEVQRWWSKNVDSDWAGLRAELYNILQREDVLKEIVRLLGPEALPDEEKLVLDVARMIKEGFLQQSAYDKVDTYCSTKKQMKMLRLFTTFYNAASNALRAGIPLAEIRAMPVIARIIRCKYEVSETELERVDSVEKEVGQAFARLTGTMEMRLVG